MLPSSRATKVKVGFFVIAGAVVLLAAYFILMGSKWFKKIDLCAVMFQESVEGLTQSSKVKYNGLDIGWVEDIRIMADEPYRGRVCVLIAVETKKLQGLDPSLLEAYLVGNIVTGIKDIALTQSVLAKCLSVPTGLPMLDIVFYHDHQYRIGVAEKAVSSVAREAELDTGGKKIHVIRAVETPGLDEMVSSIKGTVDEITKTVANINEFIRGNKQELETVIKSTGQAIDNVHELILQNQENATRIIADIKEVSGDLRNMIKDNQQALSKTFTNLDDITGKISQMLAEGGEVRAVLRGTQRLISEATGLLARQQGNIDQVLIELKYALASVRELSGNLVENPSQLIWGAPPGIEVLSENPEGAPSGKEVLSEK